MENKIVPFLSIGFVNANGNKFSVLYGKEEGKSVPMCKVTGSHIPIPVFAGTWFLGIPDSQMERSLSEIGYVKYARTNFCTGEIQVFDVPETEMETDPVMESVVRSIQNAWADAYESDAHRLYRAYEMLGGTETMENIISGVEFGSVNRIPYDTEILMPNQFETLIQAMQMAKANGNDDLCNDLYEIYHQEKRGDVESLEDISTPVVREMSVDELRKIHGLHRAALALVSEKRRVSAICMVCNWANCTIKSAREFVDSVEKEI